MSPFFQRLDRISTETFELLRSKDRKPLTVPQSKRAQELLNSALNAQKDAVNRTEKEHAADVVSDVERLLS